MVVGDDAQSIYSFRGANFRNIMDFPKLFDNVEVIKIEENYRSVQTVLDFANHIYDGAIEKYTKVLYTNKKGGALPYIVATANANMQSKFIVEKRKNIGVERRKYFIKRYCCTFSFFIFFIRFGN